MERPMCCSDGSENRDMGMLPLRELLRKSMVSSFTRPLKCADDIPPLSLLLDRLIRVRFLALSNVGIGPMKKLYDKSKITSLVRFDIDFGNAPEKFAYLISNVWRDVLCGKFGKEP